MSDAAPPGRVEIQCRTNLDGYGRESWPTGLAAVPAVGHYVQAQSGLKLRVASLTWRFDGSLEVELHR